MTNSGINSSDFIDNHATPYTRISGTDQEMVLYSTWQIRSSATDMAHFMITHLNNGKFGNNRILKASSIDMMHSKLVQYSYYQMVFPTQGGENNIERLCCTAQAQNRHYRY